MPQFRAKARAIDLLGKGQISDLPTAISELWKNGYDAYGDNLEAYLYMDSYVDVNHPFLLFQMMEKECHVKIFLKSGLYWELILKLDVSLM